MMLKDFSFYDRILFSGISSWGRKVGRRLELLTINDNETLTYNVTPHSTQSYPAIRHNQYSR